MEAKPKVKLGNGKKRSSSWITAAICLTDAKAHAYTYNGKEYVNLNINVFDKPNDFGKDVAITLNDYKKEEANNPLVNTTPKETFPNAFAEFNDLPF
jgi:hypothetical protein